MKFPRYYSHFTFFCSHHYSILLAINIIHLEPGWLSYQGLLFKDRQGQASIISFTIICESAFRANSILLLQNIERITLFIYVIFSSTFCYRSHTFHLVVFQRGETQTTVRIHCQVARRSTSSYLPCSRLRGIFQKNYDFFNN